jgi:hypothetical protein
VTGSFTTAGGASINHLATFDGQDWGPVGGGISNTGNALVEFDFGSGPELVVGGSFGTAGGATANNIARWNEVYWTDLGHGASGTVTAIAAHRGEAIIAGDFTRFDGAPATRIAAYDGESGRELGDGFNIAPASLVSFDPDGAGPAPEALIAGGTFTTTANGGAMVRFAKWDGAAWSQIGAGANGGINSMVVFNDGSGPAVFLAGSFTTVDGVSAARVARWNGSTVTALGSGLNGTVNELAVYNNALYAVGSFTASGSTAANRVARWDGTDWVAVAGGANNTVNAAAVFGGRLYIAGTFTSIDGISANRVARWDGAAWSDAAGGADATVKSLATFDDGRGPALYVGGDFTHVGAPAVAATRLARFDGTAWSAIGTGADGSVGAMAAATIDGRPRLAVGGAFRTLNGVPSDRVGVLVPCERSCYANCDHSTAAPVLNVNDFVCFQGRFAAGSPEANCDGSTNAPVLNVNDFVCFQAKFAAGCS